MDGNGHHLDGVHLVGSIGLNTVEEVFHTVGRQLGDRLRRIPDGEPGPRRLWTSFQYPLLRASPFLRSDPSGAVRKTSGFPLLCLAENTAADDLGFGELADRTRAQISAAVRGGDRMRLRASAQTGSRSQSAGLACGDRTGMVSRGNSAPARRHAGARKEKS